MNNNSPLSRFDLNLRATQILLFFTLLIASAYFFPKWADWSQNSRMDLTLAIVDQHSFSIDEYYENTGDYALFEGRRYSDKAPGPSFIAVPVYYVIRPILETSLVNGLLEGVSNKQSFLPTLDEDGTGITFEKIYFAVVLYIVTFVVIAIPSALLGVLLYNFVRELGATTNWSLSIALIYGLATIAFPYSSNFFSHQLVAFLLFGSFYLAYKMKRGDYSPKWILIIGIMMGFALISEYPSFLITSGIFIYTVLNLTNYKWLFGLLLMGLIPGLLLMAYDWNVFHTILPVGYKYSELYTELHSIGFLSLTYPKLEPLWGISFSTYRGIFFVSPVLLLGVVGLWFWFRMRILLPELAVCTWATTSYFIFNGSSAMWEGGYSIGPRYLVPMVPFLVTGLGAYSIKFGQKYWARLLFIILTLASFAIIWTEYLGGQNFPDWTPNPLVNYSIPKLLDGDYTRNVGMIMGLTGLESIMPLLIIQFVLLFLLFFISRETKVISLEDDKNS